VGITWYNIAMLVPIEISARHIHLCQSDLQSLFGFGYELRKKSDLSQVGEFAAEEVLLIVTNKDQLQARIIGPCRKKTQVEISYSEARALGISVPLRISGDLGGSGGVKLVGPQGELNLTEGVIIAQRHLHISTIEAESLGLTNNQKVKVKISGERAGVLDNIIVRIGEDFRLRLHLDTDEANALGVSKDNCVGELVID